MKLLDIIMLLPDDTKLDLVKSIINSLGQEKKQIIPDGVVQLVEERIRRYKNNPSCALSLNEFKIRLNELRRT